MLSVTAIGNVGADAEVRDAGKSKVLSFRLASNSKRKLGTELVEHTTWVTVSLFGDRAEKLAQYVTKGTRVAVSGDLETREYEKDGQKRTSLELRANNLELLGSPTSKKDTTDSSHDEDPFA